MPTKEDLYDTDPYIQTYTGKLFHLYGSDPEEICLEDIAHALSNVCRYTGHCASFYSVAEHSLLVSNIVDWLGGSAMDVRIGRFHDATEAYLADISAPFKPALNNYYDLEDMVWKRIAEKYNLPEAMPEVIKQADWIALFLETEVLISGDTSHWAGYEERKEIIEKARKTYKFPIWRMSPGLAKAQWLLACEQDEFAYANEIL